MERVLRSLAALALLVVGAVCAVAAALVHERWWGLLLGLSVAGLTTFALPPGGLRFAFVLGWTAAVAYVVLPRAEGDYLIASSGAGYGFLAGTFAVFLVALATLPGPGTRRRRRGDDPAVSTP